MRSNTKNLLKIPHTNLKRFGDGAYCSYVQRLWNELPDNIKAADSVQNVKKQLKTLLFRKEFDYIDHKHLPTDYSLKHILDIKGGKDAISNSNYYHYHPEFIFRIGCPM